MKKYSLSIKGGVMEQGIAANGWWRIFGYAVGIGLILSPGLSWGLEIDKAPSVERRETISLADAAIRALQHNLDINISRQTKDSRLADITVEQAKFDPTLSVNGQYNRALSPLNRPVFGFSQPNLNNIQTFDQRNDSVTLDATTNLLTGGNVDLNYSPSRTNVAGAQACFGKPTSAPGCSGGSFLFNPSYTGGLALTLTQPLLRNAGIDVTKTFIRVAQNNATVEEHVFRDRVLTVLATVEQTYWEVVFANENLKVAEAALKAAQELGASNRAKAKAGIMSIVDVLQAEAAVASRVEQVLVADKTIRDQEDQLRRLLNPAEEDLRQDVRLTPLDKPTVTLEPISLQEAIDTAIEQRPEIFQAKKNMETSDLNTKFAKNQILPTLSFQGTMGMAGLGSNYSNSVNSNFSGDFYNYGAGLVLSYPLGNRSAWSTYNKRQLEEKNAEASLVSVRQQIIVGVREAVRRVQTDFKRIETTRSARIMAEKQLQAEQERLKVGLSTTRFVLDFQRDLATAQGNELRATVDYNKSLSNLARHKATTLDRYNLQLN
jgi:outer membrane protein TolC